MQGFLITYNIVNDSWPMEQQHNNSTYDNNRTTHFLRLGQPSREGSSPPLLRKDF